MQIELKITANSFDEIAHLFSAGTMIPAGESELPQFEQRDGLNGDNRTKEVEPELPAKKSSRKGKAAAATATEAAGSTAKEISDPATVEKTNGSESPSDAEPVTFEDLRAEASSMMDSGKIDGKTIQEMLQERFGVKAFGPLTEEQYPAAMEALRDLAA